MSSSEKARTMRSALSRPIPETPPESKSLPTKRDGYQVSPLQTETSFDIWHVVALEWLLQTECDFTSVKGGKLNHYASQRRRRRKKITVELGLMDLITEEAPKRKASLSGVMQASTKPWLLSWAQRASASPFAFRTGIPSNLSSSYNITTPQIKW